MTSVRWLGFLRAALFAGAAVAVATGPLAAPRAQEAVASAAEPETPDTPAEDEGETYDLDVLVAPIALYPDPILVAVLQSTVVPLDVIEAAQFLDAFAADSTLTPKPEWDPAVLALLAYPTVLKAMAANLDWVEYTGDAVLERLPELQDAIQQVRAEFYAAGVLKSDARQNVIVERDIIRIEPVDRNAMALPVYDPGELIDAVIAGEPAQVLQEPAPAPAPQAAEATPSEPAVDAAQAAQEQAEAAAQAAQQAAEASQQAAEQAAQSAEAASEAAGAAAVEPAPAEAAVAPAPVEAAPAEVAAAPTAYGAAPVVYAAPAAYPTGPTWGNVGSFFGGALVGGLIGYAIADDDDDFDGWDDNDDIDIDEGDLDNYLDDARQEREASREDWQSFSREQQDQRLEAREQARADRAERAQGQQEARTERREGQQEARGERRGERQATSGERQGERSAARDQRSQERQQADRSKQQKNQTTQARMDQRAQKSRQQKDQLAR